MEYQEKMTYLYVTYDTDHYEIWLGPDWLNLADSDLESFFTQAQAAFIIGHKPDLSPYDALKFEYPYTPQMEHGDITPDLLRYVGIAHIDNED